MIARRDFVAGAAALLVLVTPLSWGEVAWRVSRHFGYQTRLILGQMAVAADAAGGGASPLVATLERSVEAGVRLASAVFPALLLLQSFAALALGWTLYQRLARSPLGVPVGRLRAFRFDDNLIWGVVLALIALQTSTTSAWCNRSAKAQRNNSVRRRPRITWTASASFGCRAAASIMVAVRSARLSA